MYPSQKANKGLYERIRPIANPRMAVAIERDSHREAGQVIDGVGELPADRNISGS
jgi:hypothetical protein